MGPLLTVETRTYMTDTVSSRQDLIGVHFNPTRRQAKDNFRVLCERSLLHLFWKRVGLSSKAEYVYTSSHELKVSACAPPHSYFEALLPSVMLFGGGILGRQSFDEVIRVGPP